MIETTETTAQAAEIVENAPKYSFRRLSAEDLFLMMTIIKKIGLKEFKTCFEGETVQKLAAAFKGADSAENAEQAADNAGGTESAADGAYSTDKAIMEVGFAVGFDLLDTLLGNLPKCEKDIYTLLSRASGMPEHYIKADAVLFTEMLMDFLKKPEFPDFIKVVLKSFNR